MKRVALSIAVALLICAGVATAYNNGAGAKPPMGWNTWCTFDICGIIDKCSEAEVKREAEAMVSSGMKDAGYEYINMDDCWNDRTRDANGNLQPNPNRFPNGMKALADYVHSLGLKIGLYTSIGTTTCKNNLPGSFGHFEQDAKTFAEWGIDFVKCDNCARPSQYSEYDLYHNFSVHLNATNHTFFFALCEWGNEDVQSWGASVAQSYRIQMDHLPLYNFPLHTAAGMGFGQGTKNIIDYVATLKPSTFVKQYGWMDPDFLMTLFFPTMTYRYSKVEVSLWAMWSAPLIVATQISNMTQEKISLLTNLEVIAIDQDDSNTAADMVFNSTDNVQFWARPLANGDAAVVILNQNDYLWGAPAVNVTALWKQFGLTQLPTRVRDVWAKKDLVPGVDYTNTSYTTLLDASDVRMFRISCESKPCL